MKHGSKALLKCGEKAVITGGTLPEQAVARQEGALRDLKASLRYD